MNKRMTVGLAILLMVCLGAVGARAADSVDLKLRWQNGAEYELSMTSDQTIKQTIGGQKNVIEQVMTMNYRFSVRSVDENGVGDIAIVYESIIMEQEGSMGQLKYDSRDTDSPVPPTAKGFAGLVGQGFEMKISPSGEVSDIRGVEAMIDGMIDGFDQMDAGMKEQLRESFKRQFGADAIRENMENMMGFFPENPVTVGDSWTTSMQLTTAMPATVAATWTLVERVGEDQVRIELNSVVKPLADAEPMEMGPMRVKYDMAGTQTGHMILDVASGWTEASEINQSFSGTLHVVSMQGAENMTMDWPMSIEGSVRTTSNRVK